MYVPGFRQFLRLLRVMSCPTNPGNSRVVNFGIAVLLHTQSKGFLYLHVGILHNSQPLAIGALITKQTHYHAARHQTDSLLLAG